MANLNSKDFVRDDDGWRVTVVHADIDSITFHQAGGGFELKMPPEQFYRQHSPAPEWVWRRGTVTAEFLIPPDEHKSPALPCWSRGELWNGWGMPALERAEVETLVDGESVWWDGDNIVVRLAGTDDEPDVYKPFTLPNGVTVWDVGAGSWCWDRVEFEEADHAAD